MRSSVARGSGTPMLDAAAPPSLERTGGRPDGGRVDEVALELLDSLATPVHDFYPERDGFAEFQALVAELVR